MAGEVAVKQGELEDVLGEIVSLLGCGPQGGNLPQEMQGDWLVEIVCQLAENLPLLLYDLLSSVRVCTDDGKVQDIGWVDLFIFGSDEESSYSDELQR